MAKESKNKSLLYKNVYKIITDGRYVTWAAYGTVKGRRFIICAKTEREAALKYDIKMIEAGKNPVNILKRKVDV